MKINETVKKILIEEGVDPNDGLAVLLSFYFNLKTKVFPEILIQKIHTLGIYEISIDGDLIWKEPLFQGEEVKDQRWSWVEDEYIKMFSEIGKGSHKREALARMKKLFAENPDIRKEEVLGATESYLINTNSKFVRLPHYFIEKGVGTNKTQDILEWIDKYRAVQERQVNRDATRRLE